jgi:hypothetical protein
MIHDGGRYRACMAGASEVAWTAKQAPVGRKALQLRSLVASVSQHHAGLEFKQRLLLRGCFMNIA